MSIDSGEASHPPFDRARYPITYRATTANRWGYVVVAVIMAALGVYLARTIRPEGSADRWIGIVLPIVVAGLAAWLLLFGFRTRLILRPMVSTIAAPSCRDASPPSTSPVGGGRPRAARATRWSFARAVAATC